MKIIIEHVVRFENGYSSNWLHEVLVEIAKDLKIIQKQNQKIMADTQTWEAALVKIDTATTQIAGSVTRISDRITTLEETIKNMGLPKDQEDALLTRTEGIATGLTTLAATLEQIGKTPEDPVPVEPPVEPPVEGPTA